MKRFELNGPKKVDMYQAFLLKRWRETAAAPWRYSLCCLPGERRRGFASLESLFSYLTHNPNQMEEDMMTEHPNATLVRQAIEAFNQGNPGALVTLIDENAVFHVPGNSPIAGKYRGKAAIGGFFQQMERLSGGSQQIALKGVLTSGDTFVVAIWLARASRLAKTYEGLAGWIFKVQNGRIVEGRNLQENHAAVDAFWSG